MNEKNYYLRFKRGIHILQEMKYPEYPAEKTIRKQQEMLRGMLLYATEHCEYYRRLGIDTPELNRFPILTKQLIKDNFEALTSDEKNRFIYWDAYTGGSTAEPLHFLQQSCIDLPYMTWLWKHMGYRKGDVIVAMSGTRVPEDDLKKHIYWTSDTGKDIPYGRIDMSSLYFNNDTARYYIDRLNLEKPRFIRGYASFIYDFSRYLLDNGIELQFVPDMIQLTSESSFDYQYRVIKEAFKTQKITLQYGHSESIVFAYTYDDSFEYVSEPLYGFIEILDEDGNAVSEGECGEVTVTTLYNKVMPLIRYKTGDLAERGRTVDGKLHLNRVIGRTQDYIIDRAGNKSPVTALIQHFKDLDGVAKWQLEQHEAGKVIMHIIRTDNYSDRDEAKLLDLFNKDGNVDIQFDFVDNIPKTPRGKSPMLIQHLN